MATSWNVCLPFLKLTRLYGGFKGNLYTYCDHHQHILGITFMSRLTVANFQRARWREALRRVLRAVQGQDPSGSEIESRVTGYLMHTDRETDIRSASSPLLVASDWAPKSADDLLGGIDGLDIGRSWAAAHEDCDTIDQALTAAEGRYAEALARLRSQKLSLDTSFSTLESTTSALLSQSRTPFFGGSSPGTPQKVFSVAASDPTQAAGTTASVLGSIGCLTTRSIATGVGRSRTASGAGQLASVTLVDSSDTYMISSLLGRAWAENPYSASASWVLPVSQTAYLNFSSNVSLLEISMGQGTTVSSPKTTQITSSGVTWVVMPPSSSITLTFGPGVVTSVKAHVPHFDANDTFVWGPYTLPDSVPSLLALSLLDVKALVPENTSLTFALSTVSAQGPWSPVTEHTPILIRDVQNNSSILQGASPDPLSYGYYAYPVSGVQLSQTGTLTAGISQAKADAFFYDWSKENDPIHKPQKADWDNTKSVSLTVPMGGGSGVRGDLGPLQTWTLADRLRSGSAFGSYTDDKDWSSESLTALVLTGPDPLNPSVLQPGYNYRFSWALYAPTGAYLSGVPIGIWNPDGVPGSPVCPYSLYLNGTVAFQGVNGFSDYKELSAPPTGFGTLPTQYASSQGTSLPLGPSGASWPPYCGRINMTLRPGWNTLTMMVYVPTKTSIGRCASIIFGPDLFSDPNVLYQQTGISVVRGWAKEWSQLSEFDLRLTAPTSDQEAWAWRTGSDGVIDAVLLNHDPNKSETGAFTLDNVFTGHARNHQIVYSSPAGPTDPSNTSLNADSKAVYVQATLTSSNPMYSPFLSSLNLVVN